jgi:hypothetical protein
MTKPTDAVKALIAQAEKTKPEFAEKLKRVVRNEKPND